MRFLHLSDIHFRENYQTNLFTAELFPTIKNPQLALEKLLQELSLTVYDFILLTGDLVHEGGISDYQVLRKMLDQYFPTTPYYFCRGNHDRRSVFFEGMSVESNETGEYIHCTNQNGLRIISLDSAQDIQHEGKISIGQMIQLQEWLGTPAEKGTILLVHHPLSWEDPSIVTEVPEGFAELIAESDILGIFVGHIHQGSSAEFAGKKQFMAESLSFGVDEYPDYSLFTNRTGFTSGSLIDGKIFTYQHYLTPHQIEIGRMKKPITGNH
ncbi:metallophosphoesterase family protein [Enterococcus faecium]|uniref:metallophosphoesterase family protein n=1 Tax=Enterococcus faecium TaxID=1352 RepID=UPI0034E95F04